MENSKPKAKRRNTTPNCATVSTYAKEQKIQLNSENKRIRKFNTRHETSHQIQIQYSQLINLKHAYRSDSYQQQYIKLISEKILG